MASHSHVEQVSAGKNSPEPERRRLLSVVAPCFNESAVITLFYEELRRVLLSLKNLDYEIIFVDDGSSDDTLFKLNEIAEQDDAMRVASLSRNFGHQIAITAGMDFAVGDAVVTMDCDLQHPPEVILELVRKWHEGYDVVSAVRTTGQGGSALKDLSSNVFYKLLNAFSSTHIPRGVADFGLISNRVMDSLRRMPERHRFLRGMVSWAGYKRTFVPYDCQKRAAGQSKYTVVKMIGLALDAVFSFSSEPLRLALRLGLFITFGGFAYLGITLAWGLFTRGLVPGYASLIGVTLILGGCQLTFIGLIGQYLARVFEEVKGRPVYLLKQNPAPPRREAAFGASASTEVHAAIRTQISGADRSSLP